MMLFSLLLIACEAGTCGNFSAQVHISGDFQASRPALTLFEPQLSTCTAIGLSFRPEHLSQLGLVPEKCSGAYHVVCVLDTGRVLTFGYGALGQLGQGDTSNKLSPTEIAGLSGVQSCSAGAAHTACVLDTGRVVTFGEGSDGRLGHGSDTRNKLIPTQIDDLKGVLSCSAGDDHTVCVLDTGRVATFGKGANGRLGHGSDTNSKLEPTEINGFQHVQSCSAGNSFTVCVLNTGRVATFGLGANGRLGHGSDTNSKLEPTEIDRFGEPARPAQSIKSCSAGDDHTVCVLTSGKVVTFGSGAGGKLGHGDQNDRNSPTEIKLNEFSENAIRACSAGRNFTICVDGDGHAHSFGKNTDGQLGHDGSKGGIVVEPTKIEKLEGVRSCSAGIVSSTCLLETGTVMTFGNNKYGQLGLGIASISESLPTDIAVIGSVRSCNAGGGHTVCVLSTGRVLTFGNGGQGRLGHDSRDDKEIPTPISTLTGVRSCSAGASHTVCVLATGKVVTFGAGARGRLGHGDEHEKLVPTQIGDLENVQSCSAGGAHTVCVLVSGTVMAFGENTDGQLGAGGAVKFATAPTAPFEDSDALKDVQSCSAGGAHTVCVLNTGKAVTFGKGGSGRLGYGDEINRNPGIPNFFDDEDTKVSSCSAGQKHTVCVLSTGRIVTFGNGQYGQLGQGDTSDLHTPTPISTLGGVQACSAGDHHTVCVQASGEVVTFGAATAGRLGLGPDLDVVSTPTKIAAFGLASQVSAGSFFTLFLNCGRPGVMSSTTASPLSCGPGTFLDSFAAPFECDSCPIGRYSKVSGLSYDVRVPSTSRGCTACPGELSNLLGQQQNLSQCECVGLFEKNISDPSACVCPKGYWLKKTGGTRTCSACSPGKSQAEQTLEETCSTCAVGQFQSSPAASSCALCEAGQYQMSSSQSFCQSCGKGRYLETEGASAASDCKPCAAGRYVSTLGSASESACFACAAGQHQPAAGSWSCIACAAGRFESSAESSSSSCKECPGGKYQDDTSQAFCKSCSGGTRKRNSTSCDVCLAGHFSGAESDACEECARGQYADKNGLSKCILCPSGYTQGAKAETECTSCGAGKSSVEGSMSCSDCGAGTYFEDKDHEGDCHSCEKGQFQPEAVAPDSCTVCPAGKYQTEKGQAFCSSCPAGKHQPDSNTTSCLSCGAGNYSGTEASVCVKCGSGTVPADGRSKCRSCTIGHFSRDSANETCAECPAGNVTDTLSRKGGSTCTACEAGRWSASAGVACNRCAKGRYLETEGASAASDCKPCAAGRYVSTLGSASESACFACAAGQHQPAAGSWSCIACAAGRFESSAESSSSSCKECPGGKYQDDTSRAFCETIAQCEPGRFVVNASEKSEDGRCGDCPLGYYQSSKEELSCDVCPSGKYQDKVKQAFCDTIAQCEPGRFMVNASEKGEDGRCGDCPLGYYQSSKEELSCDVCPSGKYQDKVKQAFCDTIAQCEPGRFVVNASEKGEDGRCGDCPLGYYQSSKEELSCDVCPSGKYQDKVKQAFCDTIAQCEPGRFVVNASEKSEDGRCGDCPLGYYQSSKEELSCDVCPSGKYQDKVKQAFCDTIAQCEPGRFVVNASEKSEDGRCGDCPLGYYQSSKEELSCDVCPSGKYQDKVKQAFCDTIAQCEPGRFVVNASEKGEDGRCGDCPLGYYQSSKEELSCDVCPSGKYQDKVKQTYCESCQPGMYLVNQSGLVSCKPCPSGYFSPEPTSSCAGCPKGKYQDKVKQAFCDTIAQCEPGRFVVNASEKSEDGRCGDCPQHYYQQTMDQSSCEACPDGKYQNKNGSFYCDETKADSVLRPSFQNGVQILVDWECPAVAMECNGLVRTYRGGVWHNPEVDYPDKDMIYTCVNEGCPDEGATKMGCKVGYTGPLCALCDDGFFASIRECVECKEPQYGLLAAFCSVLVLFIAGVAYAFQKFNRYMSPTLMTHFKILVAFITILATIDTEFGVSWPPQFLAVISFLSVFAFDPTAICHGLCLLDVSFYDDLVFSTAGLVLVLIIISICCVIQPQRKAICLKTALYLLLFAYPLVSVRVVSVFSCHTVKYSDDRTEYYLRADYNLKCYDARWTNMAIYAAVFLVVYVAGLPVFILHILLRYQRLLGGRKEPPASWLLGFLLDDYKLILPAVLWEFFEIIRKLSLSTVGSFWSDKSPMAIATAFLISVLFLLLQHHYQPFKDRICNLIQQMEMQCLCLAYFAGLLIKVNVAETNDEAALGYLLAVTVLLMLFAVLGAATLHVLGVVRDIRAARHMGSVLKSLPQEDPSNDSDEFYLIQIPVEPGNLGADFEPKLPQKLSHISPMKKLKVVHSLTVENEEILYAFFEKLGSSWTTPLRRVRQPHQVDGSGSICLKCSRKTDESILAKATRPSILAAHPQFSVEHVRDTFRFKAVVFSFHDALRFVWEMDQDRSLCRKGLSPACVAKLDIAKLREPKEWGWRFLAFDFIMLNHQIVECYIVFTEMEEAKKHDDPTARVCSQLSNHELFEKWRPKDTSRLQGDQKEEFQQDLKESRRRYDSAFKNVLSHTTQAEWVAFWSAFGVQRSQQDNLSDEAWRRLKRLSLGLNACEDEEKEGRLSFEENPMQIAIAREREIKKRLSLGNAMHKTESDAPGSVRTVSAEEEKSL